MHPDSETKQEAGRVALFALRAGTVGTEPVTNIILLPKFAPIEAEDLAWMMAHEERHLTCVALRNRTTLSVGWWPTEPTDAERHRQSRKEMLAVRDQERRHADADGEVLLVGGAERLTISRAALKEFMLNYYLPFVVYQFQLGRATGGSSSRDTTLHLSPAPFDLLQMRMIT